MEGRSGQRSRWAPVTDVSETPGQFLLEVDIPGVSRTDIELTVAGRRLELKGVRAPLEVEGRVLVAERPAGSFVRELLLPREFTQGPEADYREGVLTIRFAKTGSPEMGNSGLPPGMATMAERWPLLDILDTGHGLMLLADLPGVSQESIDVLFEGQVLTLRGLREPETSGRRYRLVERPAGAFSRSILLPEGLEGDRIQATYKDGVLSVMVPTIGATVRPRKPAASAGGTSSADPELRGELESLRAQHQALRDELDGFWLALGCGLRLVQIPLHQHLPVEVSLRDEDPIVQAQVMAAVRRFVEFAGFEVWRDYPREGDAFLKRWQVRTRRKETQLELPAAAAPGAGGAGAGPPGRDAGAGAQARGLPGRRAAEAPGGGRPRVGRGHLLARERAAMGRGRGLRSHGHPVPAEGNRSAGGRLGAASPERGGAGLTREDLALRRPGETAYALRIPVTSP
ncbi:Hsp20 family protein [Archangium gephyra]|uniref:Hsp20 family protein n=1 Tax=Archangium gephyra TaxID=48 RepID=UPI003B81393D